MMVTEQIAALRALGTDPIRKLVLPRILAGCHGAAADRRLGGIGMVGGWIVTVTQSARRVVVYWNSVVRGSTSRTSGWD
jgi:phospholipid/cholesterol/gamma-HCH transport system permease protein